MARLPSLIPTEHWDYTTSDMFRGCFTALAPRLPGTPSYISIPGLGRCLPIRSARAGIVVALKALGLRRGASIAVPLYCCTVVLKAIEAAGYRVRFIDIDPDTYCLSATDLASKSSGVDAVIAVHMFGNLCDMPSLRLAAPNRPIIEDCAQALGSLLQGRPAGSFGEISVFSFRSGKYLSVGEGGAIHASDANIEPRLSELVTALPVPNRADECVHVASTYLRSLLRTQPLWGAVGSRLWDAYNESVAHRSQSPVVSGKMYETDLHTTLRRLPVLASRIDRQRRIADYYLHNLSVDAGMLCTETPGTCFNRLQFPLRLPTSQQCDRLARHLRENGVSTAKPYKDIATIAAEHYGYAGDCPQAERIANTVLVIPCHHALNAAEVERIATCVNNAWAEIGDHGCKVAMTSIFSGTNNTVESSATEHTI